MGLTLGCGIALSMTMALWVNRWEQLSRRTQFQQQTNNLTTALQRNLSRYTDVLLSIQDLYRVADNQVTEVMFGRFVQRALVFYPGIQALEWAPRIDRGDRPRYEQQLRQLGLGVVTITERQPDGQLGPAEERHEYVPVTYVEPWEGNEVALGYDLASDSIRRAALYQARDTGQLAATGRIRLVQETAADQYSFLVFLPIGVEVTPPPGAESSPEAPLGYVLGVFRVADVVEEALRDLSYTMDFRLYDLTGSPGQQFLGQYATASQQVSIPAHPAPLGSMARSRLCPTLAACRQTLTFAQREWAIEFAPTPGGLASFPWGATATLVLGLLLTGSLLLVLSRSQAEVERTREISDLKLRFFSMASHEMRTPLSIILVSAQSLAANHQTWSEVQRAKTIERIQTITKRTTQLLSDILTLSRAEANHLDLAPEIVNIIHLSQQIVDDLQPELRLGQTITAEAQLTSPQAYVDPKLVRSILLNLLSNAIKYSSTHSAICLRLTQTSTTLDLQVQDQGLGIPAVAQTHICEAFYRGDNVGDIPGTGLGLAVVKTCVELHQGHLTIHSQEHQGTTVTVTLPRID
ncbi:MAG: CHASE domain-containing protein [Nodosilinea sp.]